MDQNVLNDLLAVVLNVASNGLTSLLAQSSHKIEELIVVKEFLEKQQVQKTALQPILQKAMTDVAEKADWDASKGVEIVSLFLRTPEVEEIVRQIYSTNFSSVKVGVASSRKIFITLLTQYFTAYPPDFSPQPSQFAVAASLIFDVLLQECDLVLKEAIDKGVLAAHEAQDAFRYNVLQSQIEAIYRELELFSAPYKIDRRAILAFEKQYRKQVGQRCGRLTPPNLSSAIPYPIDDLYVYPSFLNIMAIEPGNSWRKQLNKAEFLSSINRTVLLGDPGAGKSTLTLKVCYDLANNYSERLLAGKKEVTPILVVLRDYGAEKKARRCSLLEFIELEVKLRYQLPTPPSHFFEYLLLTGRAAVIFDGLDELLDTSYRQEIRDDVEAFCHLYPSVPVLVTSRKVGYEQAPLNQDLFEIFQLAPFSDQQVRVYAYKWFAVAGEIDLTKEKRREKAEAFLDDSKIVPDLRSNPLMLALLCTIYREEHYIPRYRPDVYEKCAVMLFERWDKKRGIYAPPLPEEEIRPLMEYLARWIYQDERLRAGLTEEELLEKTTEYLHEWIYESIYKAEKTAHEFVLFCTGRAWVFTDTGTRKFGEKLFQFTHTTFLEYFTAANFVHNSRTPDELLTVLIPRIARREWDVMTQLAFQLESRKNIGAGDELLTKVADLSLAEENESKWNMLSFAVRCLQFIVPRPATRRYIASVCIELCTREHYAGTRGFLDELLSAAPENEITVFDALGEILLEQAKSDDEQEVLAAIEFYLYYPVIRENDWRNIINNVIDNALNKVEILGPKSLLLSVLAIWNERISVSQLIDWHQVESLLYDCGSEMFPNSHLISTISDIISTSLSGSKTTNIFAKKIIKYLGEMVFIYKLPFMIEEFVGLNLVREEEIDEYFKNHTDINTEGLTQDEIFGLLVAFALKIEVDVEFRIKLIELFTSKMGENDMKLLLSGFCLLLLGYFQPSLVDKGIEELDKHSFTSKQKHFFRSWLMHETHLIKLLKKENNIIR